MAESASIGSSVEGEKLELQTRKFYPYPMRRCPRTNKWQHPFSLAIFGSAEIHQAYNAPQNEAYLQTSMVAAGDSIHGSAVSGWASKTLKEPNIVKATGTHSANSLLVKGGCFAQVDAPPREHSDSADIQKRHPPVTQIPFPQK
ncbi:hypothetical protein O3301_08460 [Janthinobacterium sp. SUN211]|uniref:hypothetical protein n=1 Tax=Janthinobacterium sp. SUN211 TaxID=3014786 RepID=UPI002713690B|nr:hypothetical protein [Janthinobacterium sp. SUN211]MDO8048497.1 hypothetical protein [Janthinobacterium sp. SUN211]